MGYKTMLLLLAILLSASFANASDYSLYSTIRTKTYGVPYALKSPYDVYADETNNRLYVADTFDYAIHSYFLNNLTYISTLAGASLATGGALNKPVSLVVRNGKLYVADQGQNNIQRYTTTFSLEKTTSSSSQTGVYGMNLVSGVDALEENGTLYISDTGNNRILVYDSDFKYLFELGTYGTFGDDALNYPRGISIRDGKLYIADSVNDRVKVLYVNGTYVRTIGIGADHLYQPNDVYAGADGLIYVADMLNDRVVVFSQNGNIYSIISGNYSGQAISRPRGVYADISGKVYIADTGNNRILVFQPSGILPAIATSATSAMENASALISSLTELVSASAGLPSVSASENGSTSYLVQAQAKYAERDYPGAFQDATESLTRIRNALASLEGQLDIAIPSELTLLYGRFSAYDRNISSFKLHLSTSSLRAKALEVNESFLDGDYISAVQSLASLKASSDGFESEVAHGITDTQGTKQGLTNSISVLLSQSSALKELASTYRQELNTSSMDADLSQAASLLSRNLTVAGEKYESAKAAFSELNASLRSTIVLILDANASLGYARAAMAEVGNVSGLFSKPDLAKPLSTLDEAERILYSQPELAKELASQSLLQAKAEEERVLAQKEALVAGLSLLLVFSIIAVGAVYFVYRRKLARRQRLLSGPPKPEQKKPEAGKKPAAAPKAQEKKPAAAPVVQEKKPAAAPTAQEKKPPAKTKRK